MIDMTAFDIGFDMTAFDIGLVGMLTVLGLMIIVWFIFRLYEC
jgi:hypothetical protein